VWGLSLSCGLIQLVSLFWHTALREIDIDLNMKVSFIEYCMYKYGTHFVCTPWTSTIFPLARSMPLHANASPQFWDASACQRLSPILGAALVSTSPTACSPALTNDPPTRYKKTLTQLFAEKPKNLAHLLKALEDAIDLHQVGCHASARTYV
jgi:hypothetical protein